MLWEEEVVIINLLLHRKSYLRTAPPEEVFDDRYVQERAPPAAVLRPPGYEEAVARPRTASGQPLHTIAEEQSVASRTASQEHIPMRPPDDTNPTIHNEQK